MSAIRLLWWGHVDDVVRSLLLVMFGGVDFRVIVRAVVCVAAPDDVEDSLGHAALEPVESHVHRLGSFWYHGLFY